jgi:hypothetical protein
MEPEYFVVKTRLDQIVDDHLMTSDNSRRDTPRRRGREHSGCEADVGAIHRALEPLARQSPHGVGLPCAAGPVSKPRHDLISVSIYDRYSVGPPIR